LSRCRAFGCDVHALRALGWGWLICIILDAMIAAAGETGLALFKTLESAILDCIAQIYPSAPRIILSFDGGRKTS
jgi:hypothetical protein